MLKTVQWGAVWWQYKDLSGRYVIAHCIIAHLWYKAECFVVLIHMVSLEKRYYLTVVFIIFHISLRHKNVPDQNAEIKKSNE